MTHDNNNGNNGNNGNGSGRVRQWAPIAFWIASTLVSVSLAYGVINARLDVLEVKYDRLYQDIAEIKADVKTLLRDNTGR